MSIDVIMPQMGESVAEGTITKWLKKVGDPVEKDEPLFEISTDKVDAEIPSPTDGVLSEIVVPEGETVEVNVVVARIGSKEEAAGASEKAPPGKAKAAVAEAGAEKAAASQAAPAAEPRPPGPVPAGGSSPERSAGADGRGGVATVEELRRTRSSPIVRRIAREHGVDLRAVRGTGISGRVTKQDILEYIEQVEAGETPAAGAAAGPPPVFAPGENVHLETMTPMRKMIAEHMVTSRRTSAHVQTFFEIDVTGLAGLVRRKKDEVMARDGVRLTYMPFITKACVDALKAFPVVNSSVDGDKIVYKRDINIGIAVALDWGLLVPVVRNADSMSILGLARAVQDLAERARAKQLSPDEVQGGTFTITNPGVTGSIMGTPIINQPQVAILGVGRVTKRPVVIDDAIAIRSIVYMVLSFDHRVIDGAVADRFMSHIKSSLESDAMEALI
jgi:pyruvate dehydrogenase E2 component (dihydrolipoamide acetyltransferase)